MVPNRIFDAETFRTPLERLLERSWEPQEPKKSWERLFAGFGPKRGPKWEPEWHPKTLQDACMRPRCSKKAPSGLWGPILTPSGSPQDLKDNSVAHLMSMLRGSPGGLPGALCKTSKSIPRYSKTHLFCQEHSEIFHDKPPKTSLLERKPRSLQERKPRRARAGLRGVGGGASP